MYIIVPKAIYGPKAISDFLPFNLSINIIEATIPPNTIAINKLTKIPLIPINNPQTPAISASPCPIPFVIITIKYIIKYPITPPKILFIMLISPINKPIEIYIAPSIKPKIIVDKWTYLVSKSIKEITINNDPQIL